MKNSGKESFSEILRFGFIKKKKCRFIIKFIINVLSVLLK